MQLVVAVIQDRDTDNALEALTKQGLRVTRVATSGGFLEQGNTTLLVGVEEAQLPLVTSALREACRRRTMYVPMTAGITDLAYGLNSQIEVEVGGATLFAFNVAYFEQI
jgi:uncharacterized protein YaaQ